MNLFQEADWVFFRIKTHKGVGIKSYSVIGYIDSTEDENCNIVITRYMDDTVPASIMEEYPINSLLTLEFNLLFRANALWDEDETIMLMREAALIIGDKETFYNYKI